MSKDLQNSKHVTNVYFVVGDAHHLPEEHTGHFDLILIFDALHDMPNPGKGTDEVRKVMKDGNFCLIEIGIHTDPLVMLYSIGMFTCLTASLANPPHVGYGPT